MDKSIGVIKDVRLIEPEKIYGMAAGWEAENIFLKKIAMIAYEPQSQIGDESFRSWMHRLMMAFREYQIWISDNRGHGIDLMEYLDGKSKTTGEAVKIARPDNGGAVEGERAGGTQKKEGEPRKIKVRVGVQD